MTDLSTHRFPLIAFFALVLSGCGLQLATTGGEARAGAELSALLEAEVASIDAPALVSYVDSIGQRLVESPNEVRRGIEYRIRVLDLADPYAFALPGGYIYVSRGLLVLLNDESELASVLAHEIGHVSARHHLRAALRRAPFVPVLLATDIASGAMRLAAWPLGRFGAPVRLLQSTVATIGLGPGSLYLASHSRSQENEADEIAQRLTAGGGWDPNGMSRVMETLSRDMRLRGGDPDEVGYLATHPSHRDRVERTRLRAERLPRTERSPIAVGRARFLAVLDGLLVGPSARHGVIDGSEFLHADLDLRLAFPEGWHVANGGSNVTARPADDSDAREVFAALTIAATGGDPAASAQQSLNEASLEIDGEFMPMSYGALAGVHAEGRRRVRGATYRWSGDWIAHRGLVFQIFAAAPEDRWVRYRADLERLAASFRPLRPGEREKIVEARLRIVETLRDESVAALLERHPGPWDVGAVAAANGIPEHGVLPARSSVKLALWEVYSPASHE